MATHWSGPATHDITRTFDALGRVTSEDNGSVRLAYVYDAADQLLAETSTIAGQPPRTVGYQYTADGLASRIAWPGGSVVTINSQATSRRLSPRVIRDRLPANTMPPDSYQWQADHRRLREASKDSNQP